MEELRFNTPSSKGNGKTYNKTRSEANQRVNKMLKVDAFMFDKQVEKMINSYSEVN